MIIDEKLIEEIHLQAKESPRLRMNYDLRNSCEDTSQRMLNVLQKGTIVPIHRHMETSETVILIKGKIDEIFYNENGDEAERFHLNPLTGNYGIQIPKGQWHTLVALEDGCVIFEVKDGAYAPINSEDIL